MRFRMFPQIHPRCLKGRPRARTSRWKRFTAPSSSSAWTRRDRSGLASARRGLRKASRSSDGSSCAASSNAPRWQLRQALRAAGLAAPEVDVVLYGELFGGAYPHPAVPALTALMAVQTGIWYAADLRCSPSSVSSWRAPEQGGGVLLGASEVGRLAAAAVGLLAPPVLGRGSRRAEVLALAQRFPTRVPALLGLPPIDGNVAEGFVVALDRPTSFDAPVACKRKIPEMREAEFDGSEAFAPDRVLPVLEILALVPRLVNRARLESAGRRLVSTTPPRSSTRWRWTSASTFRRRCP